MYNHHLLCSIGSTDTLKGKKISVIDQQFEGNDSSPERWLERQHSQDSTQVCQIEVETDTLTKDGAVDLKTIAVFLFLKRDLRPMFFAMKFNAMSAISFAEKQIKHT